MANADYRRVIGEREMGETPVGNVQEMTGTGRSLAAVLCLSLMVVFVLGVSAPEADAGKRVPLLGSRSFAPNGFGFGTAHPRRFSNGGAPSGLVENIRWRRWGRKVAIGRGRGHQYRPNGGYYFRRVKVRIRATRLGRCGRSNRPAYTRLWVQMQKRPDGRFGRWFRWSGSGNICSMY